MIHKSFTVLLSSLFSLLIISGCSSDRNNNAAVETMVEKTPDVQSMSGSADHNSDSSSSEKSSDNSSEHSKSADMTAAVVLEDPYYNSSKEYGSLWKSDLFDSSRFTMKINLNDAERKEARILARSFESHMGRGKVFMHYLLSELKARNLPAELAAVPLVESGFKNRARSHANAHGPWQFTRRTGKSFGLSVNDKYDEFYDFVASTRASLTYLEHLYRQLGNNWDLALVAYNQGEFGVKKLIRRAKANGVKNITAENIKLTKGGRSYLKRFKAYAAILQNPEKFGVEHPAVDNRVAFRRVQVAGRVASMTEAARMSGVDIKVLKHLNAGYLTDSLISSKNHGLLVPSENAWQFEKAIGHKVFISSPGYELTSVNVDHAKSSNVN